MKENGDQNDQSGKVHLFRGVIARKFLLHILIFSSAVTLILTSMQLYMDYRQGLDSIKHSAVLIQKNLLDGISNSLWLSDMELLRIQLDGMVRMNDIQYMKISHNNETLAEVGTFQERHVFTKTFPLTYTYRDKQISLGTMHVVYTLKELYKRLWDRIIIISVSQSIKTFIVSAFIFVLCLFMLVRHLNSMAAYAGALTMKTLDRPLVLDRKQNRKEGDEIDQVVTAINDMRHRLLKEIEEHNLAVEALKESDARYRDLFEDSPISLWEEDFSEVKKYIDGLRNTGVSDFRSYFEEHSEAVRECTDMVKILDVNSMTLKIFKARDKDELYAGLTKVFGESSFGVFREELIVLSEGGTIFESEASQIDLAGNEINVVLNASIAPGHETSWARVVVSIMDITQRRQAEDELKKHREHLEELVRERTRELEERYAELEKMHDLFVGREFRIKELRDRVRELEDKLNTEDLSASGGLNIED